MQEREAFGLLTLASARDNRAVTAEVARVWAADLHGIDPADAATAMQEHYRERPDVWLLPGHIVQGVRRLRTAREAEAQRALRDSRRAIEADEAAAEWAVEKAFRAEHGMSRLAWAMKQQEDK